MDNFTRQAKTAEAPSLHSPISFLGHCNVAAAAVPSDDGRPLLASTLPIGIHPLPLPPCFLSPLPPFHLFPSTLQLQLPAPHLFFPLMGYDKKPTEQQLNTLPGDEVGMGGEDGGRRRRTQGSCVTLMKWVRVKENDGSFVILREGVLLDYWGQISIEWLPATRARNRRSRR
ncbi:hypothetical protein F3Y22_tig00111708pilonHSYRG00537 [Hibiscus syriacus]|uniref:Uncharacterized protein n=1 Tax=Hibiscus syriacus TaxID=106335 RepID=A0A6A2YBA5_HIBSY|nr:hypothetical protein F3Y22_tig00111708pilonHSYRG00537 [Hibiscus syriacus]